MSRVIEVRGQAVGGGREPVVCIPLVGRTTAEILAEMGHIVARRPGLIEWRVDFYSAIASTGDVLDLCGRLAKLAGGIPLIFTIRSQREGGQPIPLSDEQVAALCISVCETRSIGLIDFEISAPRDHLERVRSAARATDTRLILSYHNFRETPDAAALLAKFTEAHELGADVAKVAVMPQSPDDVLVLLGATLRARQSLPLPLISMSMGAVGALTRVAGWMFGSTVTFAVGQASSAPGQLPVEELNVVVDILQRAVGQP